MKEVDEILAGVYDLGTDDLAESICQAFEKGVLDIPFPASQYVHGAVMPARDHDRAVRYMDTGNLPFGKDIIEFHRQKLAHKTGRDYDQVIEDILLLASR